MPATDQRNRKPAATDTNSGLKQLNTISTLDLCGVLEEAGIPPTAHARVRAAHGSLEEFSLAIKQLNPNTNPTKLLGSILAANPDDGNARAWAMMRETEGTIRSMECAPDYVNMYDGKHSSDTPRRTSRLEGCIATLVYCEDSQGPHVFVTHYAGLDVQENITKLRSLRTTHAPGELSFSSAVLLVPDLSDNSACSQLELALRLLFPGISPQRVPYHWKHEGEVQADPSLASWESSQLGRRSFREVY